MRPDDRPLLWFVKVSDTESPVSVLSEIPGVRHQCARLGQRPYAELERPAEGALALQRFEQEQQDHRAGDREPTAPQDLQKVRQLQARRGQFGRRHALIVLGS